MANLIHTCYRITDIDRSVAFYEALGFEEVGRFPIRDEAINVFMNIPGDGDSPRLELTYNHGVDSYELGTAYGHIAITADDLDATLEQLAGQGIEPEKPPYTRARGRLAPVLRARPRRLPDRADREALARTTCGSRARSPRAARKPHRPCCSVGSSVPSRTCQLARLSQIAATINPSSIDPRRGRTAPRQLPGG